MKTVARKSWAILLAFVVAFTTLFAVNLTAFADGEPAALDYAGETVNFIDADGGQFGMFTAGDGTTAVIKGDEVVVHYVLTTTRKTYIGLHQGPITDIPTEETADVKGLIDIPINDDLTIDFTVSKDLCGKMVPFAPVKATFGGSSNSWTSAGQYYMAIPAEEYLQKEEEPAAGPIELAMTNNCGSMFLPEAVSISGEEGSYVLHLTMGSASLTKVFVGYASEATDEAAIPITVGEGKGIVEVPVASVAQPIILSFYGRSWRNRQLTIDLEAKTAVYDNPVLTVDEIKDLSIEEAIKRAKDLATVELVDELITAIQVQSNDENVDKYCQVAKAYYDALSEEDKAEVEEADYFGGDTGDASLDDPRNQNEIGEKELLVVSFGTSFNDSRVKTIKAVEDALAEAYPNYSVRRAFTSQIIINHIWARDGEKIDNIQEALERAVENGVKEIVVQPTHLMSGLEYDELNTALLPYNDIVKISIPLLASDTDKEIVAKAVIEAAMKDAEFADAKAAENAKTALVLMGHGTEHSANKTYTEMQETIDGLGYKNVFVGTVEGLPESTEVNTVLEKVQAAGYEKVILRPLMVVAGDHANNDMADLDDEESWASIFSEALGKENVTCQIKGLGELEAVQDLYVKHAFTAASERCVLNVTNNVGMFKPATESVISGIEGKYLLDLYMQNESYSDVFVGPAVEARANEDQAISLTKEGEKDYYFEIELQSVDAPFILSFKSASNGKWYNRTLTIDLSKGTAVFDPTQIKFEQFENMTVEDAIAVAEDFATPELVDALIGAIQVQERDENTDKYCTIAKAYYDVLSDKDKAKLEEADYFGKDTGDASLDDPRNQNEIGKKELLVVSFGTSFNDSRVKTIKAVEDALAKAYPDYSVRRAFTAQIIINHIQARDAEKIDNMEQALDRAVENGVEELVVQPTHLMHGAEYDEMCKVLANYEGKIKKITISEPLLNDDEDQETVAKAVVKATLDDAKIASLEAADAAKTALVFMGHGTEHAANVTYEQMQEVFDGLGYKNVFVGTVEGLPESTEVNTVLEKVQAAGYEKVILRPLMVVAGDHANNDMADLDDEESWASIFSEALGEENVTCQIAGLGEIEEVQQLYVQHVEDSLREGLVKVDGVWKYFENGKFTPATGVVTRLSDGRQFYVENGVLNKKATGLVKRVSDKVDVYVEKGEFSTKTGVVQKLGSNNYYYVKQGVIDRSLTGIAKRLKDKAQVYVENGKFKAVTRLVPHTNGSWYYVEKGVRSYKEGIVKHIKNGKWYYVKNGKLNRATGVATRLADGKELYVEKGVVNTKKTDLVKRLSDKKSVYVKNGVFQSKVTGGVKRLSDKKWYYVEKGVFKKATGLAKQTGTNNYIYFKNGTFTKFTGKAKVIGGGSKTYNVKNGKLVK